ncbi:MAG: PDDEXK nuclease domain-containing protein [Chitinophagaceae bacterium]|nr:PDDEXK nuclease domain-containing protein [Chitinophagaceae bacterium]
MDFKELIYTLQEVSRELQQGAFRAVNTSLTIRNWLFGFYIVEFEQNGKDRAEYGEFLLHRISVEMKRHKISNTNERELRRFRQFYTVYSSAKNYLMNQILIRELINPELRIFEKDIIRGTINPELEVPENHYQRIFNQISYSHFVELIRIEDSLKRLFYEIECIKGVWSVKELKRQIGSLLYERTGLSKNKEKLLDIAQQNIAIQSAADFIKDPYIFEFLGLKQRDVLPEKELESILIDHLLQFLLELGKGFCFEARQKRIVIDNEHHFIDLVFYHRILHCNVLIELKNERFNHKHSGQLNMYLEYFKKYEMTAKDNPPIGILLCTEKDAEHVAFATAGLDDKIFISKYLVDLPDKKELEQFIKREIEKNNK